MVEAIGAVNVDAEICAAIQEAVAEGFAVVIATRVPYGKVEPIHGNAEGGRKLQETGAIRAGDLSKRKAWPLLMARLIHHGGDPDAYHAI